KHRGLFKCVKCGFVANADTVGAFNMAKLNGGELTLSGHGRLSSPTPLIWNRHMWKPYRRNDNPEPSPHGVGWIGVTGLGHPVAPPFIGAQRIPPIYRGE
ncbi:MAG: hypothetical protein ACP6IP_10730, partial [Candidatus Njordarchaeia archaeon]